MLRIRLRTAILLVGIAALASALVAKLLIWDPRRMYELAIEHQSQAEVYLRRAEVEGADRPEVYESLLRRSKWHRSRAAKYARATAYPGMPDPGRDTPPPSAGP